MIVAGLFLFGRTGPYKSEIPKTTQTITPNELTTDSILFHLKETLNPAQIQWMNDLEQSVIRGDVKKQKLEVYHQLAHFWQDSARIFEPYAWYEAQAARLENSEKSLIFAARLFLGNIRTETNIPKKKWLALQAKELYERSLSLNPSNDSASVELGISLIYGELSEMPMEGIQKITGVLQKDSTNIYAQMALADAAVFSTQYDKAIARFQKIISLDPTNLDAILKLADAYTLTGKKKEAIEWYKKSLPLLKREEWKQEVEKRINELK
jgi:tetratricopeptide (TPR) repeat protein